jgi:hypothetical protein
MTSLNYAVFPSHLIPRTHAPALVAVEMHCVPCGAIDHSVDRYFPNGKFSNGLSGKPTISLKAHTQAHRQPLIDRRQGPSWMRDGMLLWLIGQTGWMAMSDDAWRSYKATVACYGTTRTLPVQALSEHEVADNARIIAGFEFGWKPAEVEVVAFQIDNVGDLPNAHTETFEIHVRPEGGEPEVMRLKARDAECAEGFAVLHCAHRLGIDAREVDVLSVVKV